MDDLVDGVHLKATFGWRTHLLLLEVNQQPNDNGSSELQATIENQRLAEKDRFFREFSVWPPFANFDTEGWLSNFKNEERWVAERLLTNFCYFNDSMTDGLLKSALQRYFATVVSHKDSATQALKQIVDETAFVMCEGETPHPTDSGHIFLRKLRDQIGISESQTFRPLEALENSASFKHFVFVDDFTGSGNQFVETWNSDHCVGGQITSFSARSGKDGKSYAYCCCIATSTAQKHILDETGSDFLFPAHLLSEESNSVLPTSRVWEGLNSNDAIAIIKDASIRAGYGSEDCGQNDWRGFNCLGLTLAFNHGIPDASLPIFYSHRNGWIPLMARADHV